jgi:hypothetical protein
MALPNINPSQTAAWQKIQDHFEKMNHVESKIIPILFSNPKR